jgi:hypothetical protein
MEPVQKGIRKVLFEWKQDGEFNYPISRYIVLINSSPYSSYSDEDTLEACKIVNTD